MINFASIDITCKSSLMQANIETQCQGSQGQAPKSNTNTSAYRVSDWWTQPCKII